MAKVTITIEDIGGDKVKIVASPNFETLMKIDISGNHLTPAHGYAMRLLNEARRISKLQDPGKIKIPRLV